VGELQGCFSLAGFLASSAIKRKYNSSTVALTVKTHCLLGRVVICYEVKAYLVMISDIPVFIQHAALQGTQKCGLCHGR